LRRVEVAPANVTLANTADANRDALKRRYAGELNSIKGCALRMPVCQALDRSLVPAAARSARRQSASRHSMPTAVDTIGCQHRTEITLRRRRSQGLGDQQRDRPENAAASCHQMADSKSNLTNDHLLTFSH